MTNDERFRGGGRGAPLRAFRNKSGRPRSHMPHRDTDRRGHHHTVRLLWNKSSILLVLCWCLIDQRRHHHHTARLVTSAQASLAVFPAEFKKKNRNTRETRLKTIELWRISDSEEKSNTRANA